MTLEGPVVLDISQHFVERWNEIKKRKVNFDIQYSLHDDDIAHSSTKLKSWYLLNHHISPHIKGVSNISVTSTVSWLAFPHEPEYAPNEPIAREYPLQSHSS